MQGHREGTTATEPLRPAVDIAYLVVRVQDDMFVEAGKREIVQETRGASDSSNVA